jgi:hypothetical protein
LHAVIFLPPRNSRFPHSKARCVMQLSFLQLRASI